ncbi:MAG: hypothetical protein V1663_02320 [archaeon]
MVVEKKGPKTAVSWYFKTIFIGFVSIIMIFILSGVFSKIFYLFLDNSGIVAIISIILSIIITILFVIYYNKRFIKEWKQKDSSTNKIPSKLAALYIISFIVFAVIWFITKNQLIKTILGIMLLIIFLLYAYFKFIKK